MTSNLYFLRYNNYYNRIVKKENSIGDYADYLIGSAFTNISFNPGDGIDTTQILTSWDYNDVPDYLVVTDSSNDIVSRWFVLDAKYLRVGNYQVTLKRDLIVDNYVDVMEADAYIQKGYVNDDDPAIYNQEQVTFNQIKQNEALLKDETNNSWLVGYLATDELEGGNNTVTISVTNRLPPNVPEYATISDFPYYSYIADDFKVLKGDINYNVRIAGYNNGPWINEFAFTNTYLAYTDTQTLAVGTAQVQSGDYAYTDNPNLCFRSLKVSGSNTYNQAEVLSSIVAGLPSLGAINADVVTEFSLKGNTSLQDLKGLDGSYIKATDTSKYYKITVVKGDTEFVRNDLDTNGAARGKLLNMLSATDKINTSAAVPSTKNTYVTYTIENYRVTLTELAVDTFSLTIPSTRNVLIDAPYCMFAIPFNECAYKVSSTNHTSDPVTSLNIAQALAYELKSAGSLYDLQLLPYCPVRTLIGTGGRINLDEGTASTDYALITDTNNDPVSFALFPTQSTFSFNISKSITISNKKQQNQTDSWRLCSPNYNSTFEFSAVKNNGVDYFNVDCTYKPVSPYIHLNPNFKGLYGSDFDDPRGLICSGDFSLPLATDSWLTYEAQNKNYERSFQRQIESMDRLHKYDRASRIASASVGALTGAAAGAAAGNFIGGGVGAGIGGAAGLIASAAGGVADVLIAEQQFKEQKSLAIDQRNYALDNIQALPNNLVRVSSFTANNKIFPVLEYYSCTDVEKEAFDNIIKFEGMSIGRIGKIKDFLKVDELTFIKADIIRIEGLRDDFHLANEIALQLNTGIYMEGDYLYG